MNKSMRESLVATFDRTNSNDSRTGARPMKDTVKKTLRMKALKSDDERAGSNAATSTALAFFAFSLFLSTAGCALLSEHSATRTKPVTQTEIRDVPSAAREGRDLAPRKRVMVLPFLADDGVNTTPHTNQLAREFLIKEIRRNSDDFVFIPPSDFPKDVQSFVKHGAYDLDAMSKLASQMGLAALIEGRINTLTAKRTSDPVGLVRQVRAKIDVTAQIRMVNAKNGKSLLDETRTASAEDQIMRVGERSSTDGALENDPKLIEDVVAEAFRTTAPKIVQYIDKLGWEGRVALIKGERMYLNAGRISGLQVGDILKVLEDGEDVYDPESGALIGHVPGRIKGTVEVISYFGKDGSVGIVHSGSGFKENDKVELY